MLAKHISHTKLRCDHTTLRRMLSTTTINDQKDVPSTAYTVGTCGIPKWSTASNEREERRAVQKIDLPAHLIRPICMPGSTPGGFQTCVAGDSEGGMYCIPCRIKYKYPAFSENIDFIPPRDSPSCWWQGHSSCVEANEDVLQTMTFLKACPQHK
uniref:Uncharacterized protein n=1 Tax=Homalodisca liturata TaxID=320908 RepID=A0A1B6I058_9HEMI